jgi:putative spermidine/putrescine transport system permease protein
MTTSLRTALLIAPLIVFLAVCYLLPFVGIIGRSLTLPEPGLSQYRTALTDPLVHSVALRTLRICVVVTLFSTIAAYAIALVWVRGSPLQRLLVELCVLIPFWISVLTRAFGWLALLSNRGLLNTFLENIGLISEPLTLVRNELGVVIGMVHFLLPFAVFPIASAMRTVDERALMAARGMGAGRARVF